MLFQKLRLKAAVEREYHCDAEYIGSRLVVERLPDGSIWRGNVSVFQITGHPQTDRCYAWLETEGNRRVYAARLKVPPVNSAQTAVRAALAKKWLKRVPAH